MRRSDPYPWLRRAAQRFGYHLLRADFYSPVPDLDTLDPALWSRPAPMPGVDLRLDEGVALLRELAPFVEEFAAPADPPGTATGYHYANPAYGALDGETLYAMLRRFKPARVLEIGAGWSTLASVQALDANRAEGRAAEHVVVDPYSGPMLARVRDRVEFLALTAQDIPAERFAALQDGDVLFIDTTHTLKAGGDVVRLLLEEVPALAPGVLVHVHDFFRPFEYPRDLYVYGVAWQEHYLLQALLAGTPAWEVLLANHALARLRADEVRAVVPGLTPAAQPSALWLRKRA